MTRKPSPPRNTEILIPLHFHASRWCTHDHQTIKPWQKHNAVFSEPHNLSTCGLTSVHETASTIESNAAIKPIVPICVPLIEAPRHWKTPLCPTRQEHHTHKLFCVRNWQANRNGRPNKQKNGFEMHIGTYENPQQRKSQNTINWPVQHQCIALWLSKQRSKTNCGSSIKTSAMLSITATPFVGRHHQNQRSKTKPIQWAWNTLGAS